jgi:hypothetical protein
MRSAPVILIVLATGSAQAAPPVNELVTAANAILCLHPGNLREANHAEVAKSQQRLRGLRCMRTEAGIPLTVLERPEPDVWKVSFRPQGISGGVTLWGRAASFATPPAIPQRRAER